MAFSITWTNAKFFNVIASGIMFGVPSWKRNGDENPFVLDYDSAEVQQDANVRWLEFRGTSHPKMMTITSLWEIIGMASSLPIFSARIPIRRLFSYDTNSEQFRIGRLHIHDHEFENRRISQNDTMMLLKNSPATLPNFSAFIFACRMPRSFQNEEIIQ